MAPEAARLQAGCAVQVSVVFQLRKDVGVDEEGVRRAGKETDRSEI